MTMRAIFSALGAMAVLAGCGEPRTEAPAPAAPVEAPAPVLEAAPAPAPEAAPLPADPVAPAAIPGDAAAAPATAPVALTGVAALPAPYNEANLEDGKGQFAKCRNCHSLVAAEGNKIGPNLHGVFTRHPGTAPGFKYSPAMAANPHDKWTPHEIDEWLEKPTEYLPGNAMFFTGIRNEKDRRDVIAYVMIESAR